MIPETGVAFRCNDPALMKLYNEAESRCRVNLKDFGGDIVLVEGGGYRKIWLETQPMGGEMYALRNLRVGLNNSLLFMRHQRGDGRLPGSVRADGNQVVPEFNKVQGFCFPWHALNLYYLAGEDKAFLQELQDTLVRFDGWLCRTRAVEDDGLLRSFCVYDTGEDRAVRYGDAPCWWTEDVPPEGFRVVPMASMDVTSWSYACRDTLRRISRIMGDTAGEEAWWRKADETARAIRKGLWNEARGALFDRDKDGKPVNILCHNTLRCMYWGSVSPAMADRFVREHLMNPDEFMTPFPLPSVAADDPAFRNAPENNWSGQPEGLTYQRAIRALENYGYEPLVTRLGDVLMRAVIMGGYRFTQQFDPFTGKPSLVNEQTGKPVAEGDTVSPVQHSYGPTMLAVLEYIAHRWGIHPHLDMIWFSLGSGPETEYRAVFRNHDCRIESDGRKARAVMDGKTVWEGACGVRIIADGTGTVRGILPIETGREGWTGYGEPADAAMV